MLKRTVGGVVLVLAGTMLVFIGGMGLYYAMVVHRDEGQWVHFLHLFHSAPIAALVALLGLLVVFLGLTYLATRQLRVVA